jgi:ATP-dependent RNA helicase RhlE
VRSARGIDIDQLPHVVNFELPNVPEDYVHRIGRTGRADAEGIAVSLVCIDEDKFLRDIEKLIKRNIDKEIISGFEPDPNAKAEPIVLGRRMTIGAGNGNGRSAAKKPALGQKPKNGNGKSQPKDGAQRKPQGQQHAGNRSGNSAGKPAQRARRPQAAN